MPESVLPVGATAEEAAASNNWEAIRGRIGSWGDSAGRKAFGIEEGSSWREHFSSNSRQKRLIGGKFLTRAGAGGTWRGIGKGAGQGALSSFLPYSMPIPGGMQGSTKGIMSMLPKSLRGAVSTAGRYALKWLGPAMLAYRLKTETGGYGALGGMEKAVRITGEEIIWGATAGAGAAIGTVLGGPLGMIAGAAVGMGLGYVGTKAWNFGLDVAEAPIRMATRGWNALEAKGRQAKRLELGGRVSLGNTTSAAATMRQRAIGEIYRSGINQRSILGREANYMHTR